MRGSIYGLVALALVLVACDDGEGSGDAGAGGVSGGAGGEAGGAGGEIGGAGGEAGGAGGEAGGAGGEAGGAGGEAGGAGGGIGGAEGACVELSGEVEAPEARQAAAGVARYRWRADMAKKIYTVELIGLDDEPVGTLTASLRQGGTTLPTDIDWAVTAADGSEISVEERGFGGAEGLSLQRLIMRGGERRLTLEIETGPDHALLGQRWAVPANVGGEAPALGGSVGTGEGIDWFLESTEQATVEGWLSEAGASPLVESRAAKLLMAARAEPSWRAAIAEATVQCGIEQDALDPGGFDRFQLSPCVGAVVGCTGAGVCVATGCGGVVACAACVGGGALCLNDTFECFCRRSDNSLRELCNPCGDLDCEGACSCGGTCVQRPLLGGGPEGGTGNDLAYCLCNNGYCCKHDCRCTSGCSGGDPHLITQDGTYYNFQAVGEFILARSQDGAFEVQVRQSPIGDCSGVAANKAVATTIGDLRIEIGPTQVGFVRLSDGRSFNDEDMEIDVDGGRVMITQGGTLAVVEWDTGDALLVDRAGGWLNIDVRPGPSRVGQMEGLLGDFDGDGEDDLQIGGIGEILPRPVDHQTLINVFADSWRITDETSLFTYAEGASTDTFTQRGAPAVPFSSALLSAEAWAEAEAACADIVDATMREGCMIDVACGGEDVSVSTRWFEDTAPPEDVLEIDQARICDLQARNAFDDEGYIQVAEGVWALGCPPGCDAAGGSVWGTDVYTDDSRICRAAIHAGRITEAAGGAVYFEARPGQESYTGSERNGVNSADWSSWPRSFEFVDRP